MKFTITDEAARFYKEEIPLQPGESLRFYVRVGGVGSGGFSVGVMKEQPSESSYIIEKQDAKFFVTEDDFWYLDGMTIDYNDDMDFVSFENSAIDDLNHPGSS
ncbi:iron-sulfur cluster biosynthesis family protein [Desertibacillus haloalkaliphilus]|uniref:iron-sulfur cluster biosynthesis family protein n=1 Tax=Desertibacillus haloalkaliphilus TaxID=1328930 RepID=UPI001C254869|nr:iron-sulfur cluster biosynthesis family protein [Desertibacillus haloalkaliphilus]MBU8906070.1 hypothetical protein [Desertibacillus haloalkaliphilus]